MTQRNPADGLQRDITEVKYIALSDYINDFLSRHQNSCKTLPQNLTFVASP